MICEIPIVAPDLRREETLTQIADAFRQLDNVAAEILGRISTRVDSQKKVLQDIESRVTLAQTKVGTLKGSKKAIQVFSSSKYPVSAPLPSYKPLFKTCNEPCNLSKVVRTEKRYREELKPADQRAIKDKLNFFRVTRPSQKSRMLRAYSMEEELECGLGDPPQGIKAASSYLLFNSSTNPYRSHRKFDPLDAPTRRVAEDAAPPTLLEAAPASLGGTDLLNRLVPKSFAYCPDLGEVPDLDVPVYLPDLPGVAEISFDQNMGSIAPSLPTVGDILPDLPDMDAEIVEKGPAVAAPAPPPAPAAAAPPPPPAPAPPPPPVAAPPAPRAPLAPAAPPPPRPAAAAEAAPQGGRNDLLAAIRSGRALKPAEERKRDKKAEMKKVKESGGSGGGDMMSDLMANLMRRRKGISGDKPGGGGGKPGGGGGGKPEGGDSAGGRVGAMDRVSAMIPPPKPRNESSATSEGKTDDEWE